MEPYGFFLHVNYLEVLKLELPFLFFDLDINRTSHFHMNCKIILFLFLQRQLKSSINLRSVVSWAATVEATKDYGKIVRNYNYFVAVS